MSEPKSPIMTSSHGAADRNPRFGILTLQMDFISRDGLIAGMHAWVLNKTRLLSEIFMEQKHLKAEYRELLEPLVAAHIRQHADDPEKIWPH